MGSTIVAFKAHDGEVSEVGDAGLAHFHFSRHRARMTIKLKDSWLCIHEVVFFKRLGEADFVSYFTVINFLH